MEQLKLFQEEYLKSFAKEIEDKDFDEALEEINSLSKKKDLNELLNSIHTLREIVFNKMIEEQNEQRRK